MRAFLAILALGLLSACGDGGITPETGACGMDEQKQFVLDNMNAWYLWNDRLPASVDLSNYADADALLDYLVTFRPATDSQGNPIGRFSFIDTIEADTQFFGAGEYEGYGFSSRLLDQAEEDWRLTRVFVDSPAYRAGLRRGQRIIALNGRSIAEINAAEGRNAVLDTGNVDFTMREIDGSEFTVTVSVDIVTIDPLPQARLIDRGPGLTPVGYFELATFISTVEDSTADLYLDRIFADFGAANVTDVIIDLRYNGGGLVRIAELIGDYFGGQVAENLVFSNTEYNADRAPANNRSTYFQLLPNSLNLSSLVVIASRGTASASELVTNGMDPHVNLGIVGDNTFGKPVGQVGLDFCEKRLRPTSFKTTNADNFGDYFGGLPADCQAADDLNIAVGDDTDPNIVAALSWLATGACPVASQPGTQQKTSWPAADAPRPDLRGRPSREFADAY